MVIVRRNDLFRPKNKKYQPDSEKYKPSTEKQKTEKPAEIAEIADPPAKSAKSATSSVDDRKRLQLRDDVVEDKDGRKVTIQVYDTGQVEEKVKGDKVTRRRKIRFVLTHNNTVKECIDDCRDAAREIAKITRSHPPAKEIMGKINELREEYINSEEIPLVDYVRQKYPYRLNEIEKDPFMWILQQTKEIVGYERLKLLTLLSVVSSRMKRVPGISRIHINIVGQSGAGKSSVIKSILKYVDDSMKFDATRFTDKALGYLGITSFDGRVVFLEQIDHQNVTYLREALSEEKICTYVTVKVEEDEGVKYVTQKVCIEGQPSFITTSVSDMVDLDREQIANRMLNVYLKYTYSRDIAESILERAESEVLDVDRMVFTAYMLTRPEMADVIPLKDQIIAFTDKLAGLTRSPVNRTVEILRNLIRAVAIARGKTKADIDDFNFVMQNFQLDILYNGLGLTERDMEVIEALPDEGGLQTAHVSDALKLSKQYVLNVLKALERKGVVDGVKEDGKTFTWSLTALGRRIKALVNNISNVIEVRDEKGNLTGVVDGKFRLDGDGTGDKGNAVPGNDGNGMPTGDGETNPVIQAYKYLKQHGWALVTDVAGWYGEDVVEKLKAKDMVTFNIIDGVEYVNAK